MRAKNHRIGTYGLVLAATLALATAGRARADFILTGTEHLDVTTSHSTGVLFDSSTADVWSNGRITNAYVNDQARLRILESAGHVGYLYAYNTSAVGISQGGADYLRAYGSSAVGISGGSVYYDLAAYDTSAVDISQGGADYLRAYGSSAVGISGGSVSTLNAQDTSTVGISGGSVRYYLRAYETSAVDISGGLVGQLIAYDSSTADISAGGVGSLLAYGSSAVDISGGSISYLYASGTSEITFDGYDFRTMGGLSLVGDRLLGTGLLTGKWFDGTGTWWAVTISANDPTATILAIPEPATLGLLGLGMAGVLLRRWRR